jgi:hypothetical protein
MPDPTHLQPPLATHLPADSTPSEQLAPAALARALATAAGIAIEAGMDLESWMRDAWTAYVESRPGYRQHLEDLELKNRLDRLRAAGGIGQA